MQLFKRLYVQGVRQVRRVSRFVRRNARSIQAALPFRGFLHSPESRFAQHLAHITEIERSPVLSIAENEIRKPAAERIKVTWEGIVELRECGTMRAL